MPEARYNYAMDKLTILFWHSDTLKDDHCFTLGWNLAHPRISATDDTAETVHVGLSLVATFAIVVNFPEYCESHVLFGKFTLVP